MKFQTKTKTLFATESIALADIVMNLFIFFFVTFSFFATFKKQQQSPSQPAESQIPLRLPTAGTGQVAPKNIPVIVSISSAGEIFIGDKPVALASLTAAVRTAVSDTEQKAVVVRADKSLRVEQFVAVMEAVKAAGVENIVVRTEAAKESK